MLLRCKIQHYPKRTDLRKSMLISMIQLAYHGKHQNYWNKIVQDTIAKSISTGNNLVASTYRYFMKLYSLGILLCELLNGLIPFIDQPATLIMLEKEKLIKISEDGTGTL